MVRWSLRQTSNYANGVSNSTIYADYVSACDTPHAKGDCAVKLSYVPADPTVYRALLKSAFPGVGHQMHTTQKKDRWLCWGPDVTRDKRIA